MPAKKTFVICLTIITCVGWQNVSRIFAQSKIVAQAKEISENHQSAETAAVKLLIATGRKAQQLTSVKNRIWAQTNVAGILWKHDEAAARAFFQSALVDLHFMFRETTAANDLANDDSNQPDSAYAKRAAFAELRNNYVLQLAACDPELALTTLRSLETPAISDDYDPLKTDKLELEIASIVVKTNPQQAYNLASQQLKKGFKLDLIETLKDLHKTDSELAVKLACETFEKIKTAKIESTLELRRKQLMREMQALSKDEQTNESKVVTEISETIDLNFVTTFLTAAAKLGKTVELQSDKKQLQVLTSEQMRELAEIAAKAFLEIESSDFTSLIASAMPVIQKYSPASVQLIQRKLKALTKLEFEHFSNSISFDDESSEKTLDEEVIQARLCRAAPGECDLELLNVAKKALAADEVEKAVQVAEQIKDKKSYAYLFDEIKTQTPFVQARRGEAQALKKSVALMKSEAGKIKALCELAIALSRKNEKEAAQKALGEAKTFLPSRLARKENLDSTLEIAFASSFVEVQTAFSTLENSFGQINDLITAGILISDFYDYGRVENDELLFETIERQNLSHVSHAIPLIKNLAAADFERTVELVEKFARPEIRIFAGLKIAEALLDDKAAQRENTLRQKHLVDLSSLN